VPNEVTETMFNGLGERVTRNKDDFIACKAENSQKILSLEESSREIKIGMTKLAEAQTAISLKLSSLTGKIVGGCAVVVAIIQVLGGWIGHLLK
jgi:hypothetical protein